MRIGYCDEFYGVGDMVRQATWVNLRRVSHGTYELTGNADVTVVLPGGIVRQVTAEQLVEGGGCLQVTEKR